MNANLRGGTGSSGWRAVLRRTPLNGETSRLNASKRANYRLRVGDAKSLVEPDVFHAPAVKQAVNHQGQPLDVRVQAGCILRVKDDRPRAVLLKLPIDLPHQLAPLLLVGQHRLLLKLLIEFGIAVAAVVAI